MNENNTNFWTVLISCSNRTCDLALASNTGEVVAEFELISSRTDTFKTVRGTVDRSVGRVSFAITLRSEECSCPKRDSLIPSVAGCPSDAVTLNAPVLFVSYGCAGRPSAELL